jgi:hypothetical protein
MDFPHPAALFARLQFSPHHHDMLAVTVVANHLRLLLFQEVEHSLSTAFYRPRARKFFKESFFFEE